MDDIQVTDLYAERQLGMDRRKPAPRRRVRTQPAQAMAELPAPTAGKFFVKMVRGNVYVLTGSGGKADTIFENGRVHEVSEQVWKHLQSAVDVLPTIKDRELGRIVRVKHKFEASPPYAPIPDHLPDCD